MAFLGASVELEYKHRTYSTHTGLRFRSVLLYYLAACARGINKMMTNKDGWLLEEAG